MDKMLNKEKIFFFSLGVLGSHLINWFFKKDKTKEIHEECEKTPVLRKTIDCEEINYSKIKTDCNKVIKESEDCAHHLSLNFSIIRQETQTISFLLNKLGENMKLFKLQSDELLEKKEELQQKELILTKQIENDKPEYITIENCQDDLTVMGDSENYNLIESIT